ELDQKLRFEQFAADLFDERGGGRRSSTRREQIIDQHNAVAGFHRVDVHLHFRFAILERIFCDLGFVRKLAALANWHKTDAKLVGDCRSEKKSAGVDPDDFVDFFSAATFQKQINRSAEESRITQNRRDIFEDDSFLRKIRHVADAGAEFFEEVGAHKNGC